MRRYEVAWVERVHYRVEVVADDPVEAEVLAWEAFDRDEAVGDGIVDNGSIRIRTLKED